MQADTMKSWSGWITALIAVAVLVAVLLPDGRSAEKNYEPPTTDPHQITIKFDDKGSLVFLDANRKRIPPVKLSRTNPLGEYFEHTKRKGLKILNSEHALSVFDTIKNPSCSVTYIWGNTCIAPHTWCCPGG